MNKLTSIIIAIIAAIILFPIDSKAVELHETKGDKIDIVNLVENYDDNIIGAIVQLKTDMNMLSYNELKELLEDFESKGFESNILVEYIEDEVAHRDYIIENETAEEMRILNNSPKAKEFTKIVNKYAQEESLDSRQEEVYKLAKEALDKEKKMLLLFLSLPISLIIILSVIAFIMLPK